MDLILRYAFLILLVEFQRFALNYVGISSLSSFYHFFNNVQSNIRIAYMFVSTNQFLSIDLRLQMIPQITLEVIEQLAKKIIDLCSLFSYSFFYYGFLFSYYLLFYWSILAFHLHILAVPFFIINPFLAFIYKFQPVQLKFLLILFHFQQCKIKASFSLIGFFCNLLLG